MPQQPSDQSELGHQQPSRLSHGSKDFAAALAAARQSDESLGMLLDEFRRSLHQLAEAGLQSDVRPKFGASDLVQQTLMEAAKGFAQFRGASREQLTAWLQRILVRNLLNELRKWRSTKMRSVRREVRLDDSDAQPVVADDATPSSLAEARERKTLLREALSRLTPDQQEVIRLHHFEQLGFDEIARRMNRKYSAARMLWYRAFEKLMRELGGDRGPRK